MEDLNGASVMGLSGSGKWRNCTVVKSRCSDASKPFESVSLLLHFDGFSSDFDEWIDVGKEPHRVKTEDGRALRDALSSAAPTDQAASRTESAEGDDWEMVEASDGEAEVSDSQGTDWRSRLPAAKTVRLQQLPEGKGAGELRAELKFEIAAAAKLRAEIAQMETLMDLKAELEQQRHAFNELSARIAAGAVGAEGAAEAAGSAKEARVEKLKKQVKPHTVQKKALDSDAGWVSQGKLAAGFLAHQMPAGDYTADFKWAPVDLYVGTMQTVLSPPLAPQQWSTVSSGVDDKVEVSAPSNEYIAIETQPKAAAAPSQQQPKKKKEKEKEKEQEKEKEKEKKNVVGPEPTATKTSVGETVVEASDSDMLAALRGVVRAGHVSTPASAPVPAPSPPPSALKAAAATAAAEAEARRAEKLAAIDTFKCKVSAALVGFIRDQGDSVKTSHVATHLEVLGIKKVVSVLEHKYSASPMELVSHAFKCFDTDGNGTLSKAEVQQIVGGVQFERVGKECEILWRELDVDGDGSVSLEEFASCILGASID